MSGDSEILDVVLRELESGRKTFEELYAVCAEHTPLLELARAEDEVPQDLLMLLLWDTDEVHVFGNWVMLYAEILEGRVLTHRGQPGAMRSRVNRALGSQVRWVLRADTAGC